jgi:hypothetical protein
LQSHTLISFLLHQCFYYFFFVIFFADVIRRQLAARILDKPFLHPPVLFPGLEDDSSYTQRGPQRDVAGDNVEFEHLRVCFLLQSHFLFSFVFLQMSQLFFTPTMVFAILSFFVNIRFFPCRFF